MTKRRRNKKNKRTKKLSHKHNETRRKNKKNKKINNQRQKTKKNSCNYNNDVYEIDNSNYNVNFVVGDYNSVGNEHIYGIERSRSETYSDNEGRNYHRTSVDGNENIVDANISKSFNNVNLYFNTLNVFYLVK